MGTFLKVTLKAPPTPVLPSGLPPSLAGILGGVVGGSLQDHPNVLHGGGVIPKGSSLFSPNKRVRLTMQPDGNLVLYGDDKYIWDSRTNGKPADRAVMQTDGNLVVYDGGGKVLWSSGTNGNTTAYLSVYDDGNAVIRAGNGPKKDQGIWSTKQENYDRKGGWLENIVDSAGKAAGDAVHAVTDVASSLGDAMKKVPVVGPGLHGLWDVTYGAPFKIADDVVSGKSLDKVALNALQTQVTAYREVAPYAQTVIAFVPAVGPAVSGAIGTGLALANGQSIDKALIEGVKGAIPGGALGAAAFDVAVAAAQGKDITEIAVAAIPIPDQAKKALRSGLNVAQKLVNGERVDDAIVNEAISYLPPQAQQLARAAKDVVGGKNVGDVILEEAQKMIPNLTAEQAKGLATGLVSGLAMGQAQKLQAYAMQQAQDLGYQNTLANAGQALAKVDQIVGGARAVIPQEIARGFDIGTGMMKYRSNPVQVNTLREALSPEERKGFDMATSLHVGKVTSPKILVNVGKTQSKALAGYMLTKGMVAMPSANKVQIVKTLLTDPAAADGARQAAAQVVKKADSWFTRLLRLIGLRG